MKQDYIDRLKSELNQYTTNFADVKDIVRDYEEMYDDALQTGKTPEEVEAMLGDPIDIVDELKESLSLKQERRSKGNKVVAVSPFIATICFFISGFYFDGWVFGWLFFLMIPMLGILFNTPRKEKFVALSPFISVILLITIGFTTGRWELAWLPFLSIPVLGYFSDNKKWVSFTFLGLVLLGIMGYVYVGETYGFQLAWLSFIPAIIFSIIRGQIVLSFGDLKGQERKKVLSLIGVILLTIGLFIGLGLAFDGWGWSWMFVLGIPMTAIILFAKGNIVALMPFISVVIFYSLGFFFDMFHISWIAFLLIPITAILVSKD
ncbi:DUF1700 domain-containing protein [Acholeplasma vituli]|uniref:DUF1700 domain-containing protein n=1 Tax=Paracholeplasma vituli TaxID=69473 RepID=A0ABT2PW95_9MOLU|nr:DUF1700 domain-containing protein [Paracholeplasma vituli]MCU0105235.1 DUF1700 domain-containing protein [Paracholeplasma vituli]